MIIWWILYIVQSIIFIRKCHYCLDLKLFNRWQNYYCMDYCFISVSRLSYIISYQILIFILQLLLGSSGPSNMERFLKFLFFNLILIVSLVIIDVHVHDSFQSKNGIFNYLFFLLWLHIFLFLPFRFCQSISSQQSSSSWVSWRSMGNMCCLYELCPCFHAQKCMY